MLGIVVLLLLVVAACVSALVDGMRHDADPIFLSRLPGALALFSRAARGTWNVAGPADRIDLSGRRYYLNGSTPASRPDLSGFAKAVPAIWPDRVWYVGVGTHPTGVWAQASDGSWYSYDLSGGW